MIEEALGYDGKVGVAGHEAADTLVGVLDSSLLPRRTGIAETALRAIRSAKTLITTNSIPRSKVKLRRAEAGKGKGHNDLVHDRPGVPASVFDQHDVAALALDQRYDVGVAEFRTKIRRPPSAMTEEIAADLQAYCLNWLVEEVSTLINMAATGGDASEMMIG